MQILRRACCAVVLHVGFIRRRHVNAALHPYLVDARPLPVREEADTVSRGHNLLKVFFQRRYRQPFVHVLTHGKRRLNSQRHFGDDAKRAEAHDGRVQPFAIRARGKRHDAAIGREHLQTRDGRCKIPVRHAGSMCRGRTGAPNGNVRQRGQIVERKTLVVEIRAELAVRDAGLNGDLPLLRIEGHHLVEAGQRNKPVRAVGNAIEAVPRAEHFEPVVLLHDPLHVFK